MIPFSDFDWEWLEVVAAYWEGACIEIIILKDVALPTLELRIRVNCLKPIRDRYG